MPAEILVTREILAEDAVFILQCLRESVREGRSLHMMDVRNYIASSVTLEFSDYLRFLRKNNYVALDREQHTLSLSADGDRLAQAEPTPALLSQLEQFFADKIQAGVIEVKTEEDESTALGGLVDPRPGNMPPRPEDMTPLPGMPPRPPIPADALGTQKPPVLPESMFSSVISNAPAMAGSAGDELIYMRGEMIGQGPLGAVFEGVHASLGRFIAVKEIREPVTRRVFASPAELAARLKAELGAQARLHHPAIVEVLDLDVTVPQPFAVLELCAGGNLRDRLKQRAGKGLDPQIALRAFGQLLSGLSAAHQAGVTHHNLKPENILFDEYGNAKIGDFGLSRLLAVDVGEASRTVVDSGNMSYLAPELMQQGAVAGTAADVYALGILLYEALTGRVPGRRSPMPSKAAPTIPAEIDEIFDLMTADDAAERYPNAGEALEDFHAAFPDGRYGEKGRLHVSIVEEGDELTDPGENKSLLRK